MTVMITATRTLSTVLVTVSNYTGTVTCLQSWHQSFPSWLYIYTAVYTQLLLRLSH